jgi:hypothetical protein
MPASPKKGILVPFLVAIGALIGLAWLFTKDEKPPAQPAGLDPVSWTPNEGRIRSNPPPARPRA